MKPKPTASRKCSCAQAPESKIKSIHIKDKCDSEPFCLSFEEDTRPLILRYCGNVCRGRSQPWHSLRACLQVAAKSTAVAWFIFTTPLRCLGIGCANFRRSDLRLSFFRRVQIRAFLVAVVSVLLFVSIRPKAAESETPKAATLASVDHKKKISGLSGGWLQDAESDWSLTDRRAWASERVVEADSGATDEGEGELSKTTDKQKSSMLSRKRIEARANGWSQADSLPRGADNNSGAAMAAVKEGKTLRQIVKAGAAMISGGWLSGQAGDVGEKDEEGADREVISGEIIIPPEEFIEAVSSGAIVPGAGGRAARRLRGGNYQPSRGSGLYVSVPTDGQKTFARIAESEQDAVFSGGWLGAMASDLPPTEADLMQQALAQPSGGNQAPIRHPGLDSVVPAEEEGVSVRAIEGGEDIVLPVRGSGQNVSVRPAAGNPLDTVDQGPGVGSSLFPESAYTPVNRALDVFGTYDSSYVGDQLSAVGTVNLGLPLLSEGFDPDFADVKAGPVYLDFLYLGVGALYSKVNGDQVFPEGQEPGLLSFVEISFRTYVRITDRFYISVATQLIYLPQENRFGFALGDGSGLGISLYVNYEFEWDTWDFLLYDSFRGYPPFSLLTGTGETAFQRAGRYSFGINARNPQSNSFTGDVFFSNVIGVQASTPFMWEDWWLRLNADHTNFWRGFGFENPGVRDHAGVLLQYRGSEIPFSPYISYDTYSNDQLKSFYNTAYIGGRGRLTQNVRIDARVGQLWSTNVNPSRTSTLWQVGLTHYISENTSHSLWMGQTFEVNDVNSDTRLVEYIRYQINHRFSSRLDGYAFAQFSREEDLLTEGRRSNRELYGARLFYQLFEYSRISGSVYYQKENFENNSEIENTRLIYRFDWEERIGLRSTLRFYYQFEKDEGRSNFDEHVLSLSLRRYF